MRFVSLLCLLAISELVGAQELVTFENGEVADAQDINSNFETLRQAITEVSQPSFFGQSCPEGESVTGFTSQGDLICSCFLSEIVSSTVTQVGNDFQGDVDDRVGFISISGDGRVFSIGSPFSEPGGVIRTYSVSSNEYVQIGQSLIGADTTASGGKQRTSALSFDGSTMAIAAWWDDASASRAGAVRVLTYVDGEWTQLGSTILGSYSSHRIGSRLAINNEGTVIAWASHYDAQVYEWDEVASDWIQRGDPLSTASEYPPAISLNGSGNRIIVGDMGANGLVGRVGIYDWDGTSWVQSGADLLDEGSALFGRSVQLSSLGDVAIVAQQLKATIYHQNGSEWEPIYTFVFPSPEEGGYSETGVAHVTLSDDGKVAAAATYDYAELNNEGAILSPILLARHNNDSENTWMQEWLTTVPTVRNGLTIEGDASLSNLLVANPFYANFSGYARLYRVQATSECLDR